MPELKNSIETVVADTEDVASLNKATENIDMIVQAIRLRGNIFPCALAE